MNIALVWIQWTAIYLTDADFVSFLKRCSESLTAGGVIILKGEYARRLFTYTIWATHLTCDVEDASLTRSMPYWRHLIFQAGLRVIKESWQEDFPDDIYPVPILALQPIVWH